MFLLLTHALYGYIIFILPCRKKNNNFYSLLKIRTAPAFWQGQHFSSLTAIKFSRTEQVNPLPAKRLLQFRNLQVSCITAFFCTERCCHADSLTHCHADRHHTIGGMRPVCPGNTASRGIQICNSLWYKAPIWKVIWLAVLYRLFCLPCS